MQIPDSFITRNDGKRGIVRKHQYKEIGVGRYRCGRSGKMRQAGSKGRRKKGESNANSSYAIG